MVDPEAALVKIVDVPRLSVVKLIELRAFLDSSLICGLEEKISEGGADGEVRDEYATGSVRGTAAGNEACSGGAGEGGGTAASVADGGDGGLGRLAGGGR
jgi:hypothetical protein